MTKPQSTAAYVLRLTLTLFLITVIVAGLLAFVNYLTADTIAEHTAEAARSAMTQVLAADDYTELPVSDAQAATGVTAAWSAGDAETVVRLTTNGFGGAIDLMVGVDNENKVTGVAIISHSETASLGANCTREDFRAQFAGKTGELAVSKDGGDIDALTGAAALAALHLAGRDGRAAGAGREKHGGPPDCADRLSPRLRLRPRHARLPSGSRNHPGRGRCRLHDRGLSRHAAVRPKHAAPHALHGRQPRSVRRKGL